MKSLIIALALALSAPSFANVCSQATKVCVNYQAETTFTTGQEGRFQLFLESSDEKEVSLVKADLWMQMGHHGHGSSPLKITQIAPGHFDVTKAYFVMKGTWQIRVTYAQEGQQETLIIPVTIRD